MASIQKRVQINKSTGHKCIGWIVSHKDETGRWRKRQFKTKGEADAFRQEAEVVPQLPTFRVRADAMRLLQAMLRGMPENAPWAVTVTHRGSGLLDIAATTNQAPDDLEIAQE